MLLKINQYLEEFRLPGNDEWDDLTESVVVKPVESKIKWI